MAKRSLSDFETIETEDSSPTSALRVGEDGQAQVDLQKLRETCSVFFATPCYGGMITDQYFLSIFKASQ